MSGILNRGKLGVAYVLLAAACLSAAETPPAGESAQRPNPPVNSPRWARDIAIVYLTPAGRFGPEFWTTEAYKWLAACLGPDGKARDWLFDGFLFLSPGTHSGGNMLSVPSQPGATAEDCNLALTDWLQGAARLSEAVAQSAREMNVPVRKAKVMLCIPYPDPRSTQFGPVNGQTLDLSKDDDRVTMAKWYVDLALKRWAEDAEKGKLPNVILSGFYWGREGIYKDYPHKLNNDPRVAREAADYVRSKAYLSFWIPGFQCQTKDSNGIGFDCVMPQTNYQAPRWKKNPPRPLSIFDETDALAEKTGDAGVQINVSTRTHSLSARLYTPYQTWLANFDAALRLNWARFPAVNYFNPGEHPPAPNDTGAFPPVAGDPAHRIYYDKLCKWMKRTLSQQDLDEVTDVLVKELVARGALIPERVKQISEAKTTLEKLRLMERPEAEWDAAAEQEK